ncbi:hypothetical protein GF312_03145 [Candidatus Poribacteria bacterium]|nr:hypothetical protein [Candidatus Poribacteria bacterium]
MKLEAKLEFNITTALIIAGGEMNSRLAVDKSTIRNRSGHLIIPASTIKGRLRDECQRILLSLNHEIFICKPPVAENMCPQPFINGKTEIECCSICQLFGSPWEPSPLYFSDMVFTDPDTIKRVESTTVKTRVAINRHTRIARDKSLHYLETSPQGYSSTFKSKTYTIKGEVPDESKAALLFLGIQSLFNIGGSKSVGLGWINGEKLVKFILYLPDNTELDFLKLSEEIKVEEWLERFHFP